MACGAGSPPAVGRHPAAVLGGHRRHPAGVRGAGPGPAHQRPAHHGLVHEHPGRAGGATDLRREVRPGGGHAGRDHHATPASRRRSSRRRRRSRAWRPVPVRSASSPTTPSSPRRPHGRRCSTRRPARTAACPTARRVAPIGGRTVINAQLTSSYDSKPAYDAIKALRTAVHAIPGAARRGRWPGRHPAGHPGRLRARQPGHHPAGARRHPDRADDPAASDAGSVAADRDRGPVVHRHPRRLLGGVQPRLPLRQRRPVVPALRVHLPGRARDRLQHLPDDPGARGDAAVRHQIRCAAWAFR